MAAPSIHWVSTLCLVLCFLFPFSSAQIAVQVTPCVTITSTTTQTACSTTHTCFYPPCAYFLNTLTQPCHCPTIVPTIYETINPTSTCLCPGCSTFTTIVQAPSCNSTPPTTTTNGSVLTTTSTPLATSTSSTSGTIPHWGQCAGIGWTGSGTCVMGTTCVFSNKWYSQCL